MSLSGSSDHSRSSIPEPDIHEQSLPCPEGSEGRAFLYVIRQSPRPGASSGVLVSSTIYVLDAINHRSLVESIGTHHWSVFIIFQMPGRIRVWPGDTAHAHDLAFGLL